MGAGSLEFAAGGPNRLWSVVALTAVPGIATLAAAIPRASKRAQVSLLTLTIRRMPTIGGCALGADLVHEAVQEHARQEEGFAGPSACFGGSQSIQEYQ